MRGLGLLIVAVIAGCSGSDSNLSDPDAGPDAAIDGDFLEDAGKDGPRLEREAEFWAQVAICGEWVEGYSSIGAMAAQADAVVAGHITRAEAGNVVQGDAPEDFYAEVNLTIDVDEVLVRSAADPLVLSLVLPRAFDPGRRDEAVSAMAGALPLDPVVLLVRPRADLPGVYRLVNDRALWARTARSLLDNPIAGSDCEDFRDEDAKVGYLGGARTLDQVIDMLRISR